ncbi:hypothetical protein KIN20_033785 [Parelaphostrongylus tenuis]|uniref:Tetraspanin n=1 Tax=Parelaphostrongylus tenuis TaxID=148309 RepID=A0AAD5WJ69_PARTN|nr:hypothetical protein KIN20_033785 [Parelaphostrongylus tenuis]
MVLLSCRATPFRRQLFVNISACAFALSMLSLCALIVLEIYAYITLERAEIMRLLDTTMPVINRKAIAVLVLICVVLLIQLFSINIVRGQNVENIFLMSLAPAAMLFSGVLCTVYANKFNSAVATGLLQKIAQYDDNLGNRLFVDKLQSFYNCCGVNGDEDYRDLSSVKLYGHKKRNTSLGTHRAQKHDGVDFGIEVTILVQEQKASARKILEAFWINTTNPIINRREECLVITPHCRVTRRYKRVQMTVPFVFFHLRVASQWNAQNISWLNWAFRVISSMKDGTKPKVGKTVLEHHAKN